MTAVLKKSLGEAGAFIDESNGRPSRLHESLEALAEGSMDLTGDQGSPSVATLATFVAGKAMRLQSLALNMGTAGTGGQTDVAVDVDGADVATATVDNADADGSTALADLSTPVDVAAGAVVKLEVTAIPTGGANLVATAMFSGLQVE